MQRSISILAIVLLAATLPAAAQQGSQPGFACQTLVHRQILKGESPPLHVRVLKQTYFPGKASLPHRHQAGEILYVISGSGTNRMNGKTTRLVAGHALVIPADVEHEIAGTGANGVTLLAVQMSDVATPFVKPRAGHQNPGACSD